MRCFLINSLLVLATHAAFADRKISPAANAELERGEAKFRDKDYAAAIAAFDAGYAIDPQPIFLYDKAQAQRLAGDCRAAIETYKAFLAMNPPDNEASRAKQNIDKCQATLPPPAKPAPPKPAPQKLEPEPVIDNEAAPFEDAPVRLEPELSIREQRASWWSDGLGVSLVTAGVVGIGIGTGFVLTARSAAGDTALARNVNEWDDAKDRWQRDRFIAGVALGGGATLLVGGILRLSMRDRGVAVAPQTNGAVVSLGGRW